MEGRYLLGATGIEETLSFLKRQCEVDISAEALAERTAVAERIRQDRPPVGSLPDAQEAPEDWQPHLDAVAARPLFRRLFDGHRWQFAAVSVGSIISVQPHLHYSHAMRRAKIEPSTADILERCLPLQPEALELWGGVSEGDPPSVSFFTRDPNIQITAAKMETQPLRVTFTIGKTAVFLQVARLGGRLYLKNGTHRAVGLAARGVHLLPCVLVDVPDIDSLPKFLPFRTLMGETPPLVTDFLNPHLYCPHVWGDRIKFIRLVPELFSSPVPARLEPAD